MELILIISAFFLGFILVMISVPSIIKVAKAKHLFEPFEERKIHTAIIPPLGGVAIFIGFTLSSIVATDGLHFDTLKYIIASVILMFFIGLKDDLLNIAARKKLVIQIFATIILIALADIRFTNLHGILSTHEIGFFPSFTITLLAILAIINAFNLIDGIDGLASGLAMMSATVFGVWFFIAGHYQFAIMSFALVGTLSGFFLYNVFGKSNKLFMGDTGSLIIGLVIATLVVKFNEFNIIKTAPFAIGAAPAVSLAIISIPLIDTLRVMSIRISQRKSPFAADTNHIHHRIFSLVSNHHLKTTLIIVAANIVIIALAILINSIGINQNLQFVIIFLTGGFISFIPSLILKIKRLRSVQHIAR
jgi:UDP-N-acetylmuramyl pentapeptide phosphotransferase/UDP-N-acetylglucosamine-1-phosphate transferase